jgi:hypothetical protein
VRIISSFRDYYDCIQRVHFDKSIVYNRIPHKVELKKWPFPRREQIYAQRTNIEAHIIGFCGKIYPVLFVDISTVGYTDTKRHIVYNFSELETLLTPYTKKISKWYKNPLGNAKKFFDQCKQEQNKHTDVFQDGGAPVFVAQESKYRHSLSWVEYNTNLTPFEFYRVFDPHTAFQEIYMYLNNQAEPRKEIPHISDEIMAEIKGFDPPWSFRRPPTKKR